MSKNVNVNGTAYSGISTVELNTTDGGTAQFRDVDELAGGGVTSWNDLTDKPFYSEYGELVEVLPECQPEYDEVEGMFSVFEGPSINVGETYVIKWNGVDYTCVGVDLSAMQEGCVGLGDLSMFEFDGNGEPFTFICLEGGMMILPLDGTTELTLSILGQEEIIHKIPNKYVDAITYYNIPFTAENIGSVSNRWTIDKYYSNVIKELAKPNVLVRGVCTLDGVKTLIFNVTSYDEEAIWLTHQTVESGTHLAIYSLVMYSGDSATFKVNKIALAQ